jgi:hypothetical protein
VSETRAAKPTHQSAMLERREHLLGKAYRLLYDHPLHIVRGEGASGSFMY